MKNKKDIIKIIELLKENYNFILPNSSNNIDNKEFKKIDKLQKYGVKVNDGNLIFSLIK